MEGTWEPGKVSTAQLGTEFQGAFVVQVLQHEAPCTFPPAGQPIPTDPQAAPGSSVQALCGAACVQWYRGVPPAQPLTPHVLLLTAPTSSPLFHLPLHHSATWLTF